MPNIYRFNPSENENENRNINKKKNKKDFKSLKKNTIKSLNDVEYFLNNFGQFIKYAKIYKIIKK